ncbi:ribosome-associated translation inhibitor RaiA [candidate division GN15 bacterium]|nr:ribosome-associated translation inhibitor RaiA [candidate division GN15 bacterium]
MQKKITARHFDLTPEIREKAEEEMDGLTRFFDNIISAEFILDVERHRRIAELRVKVYKETMSATAETDDMYASIDSAIDKVKAQIKKYKGKLKDKDPNKIGRLQQERTRPSTNPDEVDV